MLLKIIKKKNGSFTGSDGDTVEYYWYKAKRISDDMTLEFGSRDGKHDEDDEVDLNLEKFEYSKRHQRYREVSEE